MNAKRSLFCLGLIAGCLLARGATVERVFRPARVTRGDSNLVGLQPIDSAKWIWHPALKDEVRPKEIRIVRFERAFVATERPLVIDVSADERYELLLDGRRIARGPDRGIPDNWMYATYSLALEPGPHRLVATVWQLGAAAPSAQQVTEGRGGFILKADGEYDAQLTTGVAEWTAMRLVAPTATPEDRAGSFGVGYTFDITGGFAADEIPNSRTVAVPLGDSVADRYRKAVHEFYHWGVRQAGKMLFPSQLPAQLSERFVPADFRAETIPARTKCRRILGLGVYRCFYPELTVSGGRGATVRLGWTEAPRDAKTRRKVNRQARGEGLRYDCFTDRFHCDGRADAHFTTPWFRAGLWGVLDIETADEPLDLKALVLDETRYPLVSERAFACDDETLAGIDRICTRGMEMCCHEMLFDCPFYEQQMYPGDSRIQLNILASISRDERMIKRVIELFDLSRRNNGMIAMNFPSAHLQESSTYTLCWLLMFGDYVMHGTDLPWLKARLPGIRQTLSAIAYYESEDGLLGRLPGWSFSDWVDSDAWRQGLAPGQEGDRPIAFNNLFWVLALRSAAKAERAAGSDALAALYERKATQVAAKVRERFWDEGRALVADTLDRRHWSEHVQCLALLADILPPPEAKRCFAALVSAPDLARTTVYFSYYLFETYFKFDRGDLFLKRLDLWRDYVKMGLTTPLESPDTPAGVQARSDCHAWSSHPLCFFNSGLAGVRSDAFGFSRVRVAPSPGSLKFVKATVPHPQGAVVVDFVFDGKGGVKGTVSTPVPGVFVWQGRETPLTVGSNTIPPN